MDVTQMVTDRIIDQLNKGTVPWHKPWITPRTGAFNRITKRPYSLLNQLLLEHRGEYATLQQWNSLGGKIRKGERSETVVFWKWPEKHEEPDDEFSLEDKVPEKKLSRPMLKYYHVFHVSQVEGVDPLLDESKPSEICIGKKDKILRDYINREGIQFIQEPSDGAFYSPSDDLIHMPAEWQFRSEAELLSTFAHECAHSTGHIKRLNRAGLQTVKFGSHEYSLEELIAEISASAIVNLIGEETDSSFSNNAAYVHSWLQALKNDKRMIITASGQAEKAVKFICSQTKVEAKFV